MVFLSLQASVTIIDLRTFVHSLDNIHYYMQKCRAYYSSVKAVGKTTLCWSVGS